MSVSLRFVTSVAVALVSALLAISPAMAQSPNLLQNWGFESGFSGYGSGQVGNAWTAFIIGTSRPQFLDTGQFAFAEKTEGAHGQQIWSDGEAYHAGIYQTVTNATPGQTYRLKIAMATQYGSGNSGNVMFKRVGIDPNGGKDPNAPSVVWSAPNGQDKGWIDLFAEVVAQGPNITVFAKVEVPHSGGADKSWIDAAFLWPVGAPIPTSTPVPPSTPTPAPVPTATATPVPPPPTNTPVPPPPTNTPAPSPTPKPAEPVAQAVPQSPTVSATVTVSPTAEPTFAPPLPTVVDRDPNLLAAAPGAAGAQVAPGRVPVASSALDFRVSSSASKDDSRTSGFILVSAGFVLLIVGGTTLLILRRKRS